MFSLKRGVANRGCTVNNFFGLELTCRRGRWWLWHFEKFDTSYLILCHHGSRTSFLHLELFEQEMFCKQAADTTLSLTMARKDQSKSCLWWKGLPSLKQITEFNKERPVHDLFFEDLKSNCKFSLEISVHFLIHARGQTPLVKRYFAKLKYQGNQYYFERLFRPSLCTNKKQNCLSHFNS